MIKKVLLQGSIVLMSISLISCSTNTQQENTGVGAVTGGVLGGLAGSLVGGGTGKAVAIGVGIVAGALIGGYVGHNMDSSDHARMNNAMNTNRANTSTTWRNEKTGATYTVTPTSRRMTINGNPNCRKYRSTAIINGQQKNVYGTACLDNNGAWRAVN